MQFCRAWRPTKLQRSDHGILQAAGLASMLDLNGDGHPLDDIMRMAGKAMR